MIVEDKSTTVIESDSTFEVKPVKLFANPRTLWSMAVRALTRDLCANCGGADHLRVRMLVPEDAGGQLIPTNGTLLCRTCDMAFDTAKSGKSSEKSAINFWVSKELNSRLSNGLKTRNGFSSMGEMIRYLIGCYVQDPDRFDDLDNYQDSRVADVKLNVWVDQDRYDSFKVLAAQKGRTVTETLKGLIRMYEEGCDELMRNK